MNFLWQKNRTKSHYDFYWLQRIYFDPLSASHRVLSQTTLTRSLVHPCPVVSTSPQPQKTPHRCPQTPRLNRLSLWIWASLKTFILTSACVSPLSLSTWRARAAWRTRHGSKGTCLTLGSQAAKVLSRLHSFFFFSLSCPRWATCVQTTLALLQDRPDRTELQSSSSSSSFSLPLGSSGVFELQTNCKPLIMDTGSSTSSGDDPGRVPNKYTRSNIKHTCVCMCVCILYTICRTKHKSNTAHVWVCSAKEVVVLFIQVAPMRFGVTEQ